MYIVSGMVFFLCGVYPVLSTSGNNWKTSFIVSFQSGDQYFVEKVESLNDNGYLKYPSLCFLPLDFQQIPERSIFRRLFCVTDEQDAIMSEWFD